MKRRIFNELVFWKDSKIRKPLLLRGARQVGKTHVIRAFAEAHFDTLLEINFELEPHYKPHFKDLNPKAIVDQLGLINPEVRIEPGKTLLFLDEIQDCPDAIMALRYFKELMPELHVIAAGSLLEFTLRKKDFRMPVGRVEYRFMYPMSFQEFLQALGYARLSEYLTGVSLNEKISNPMHQKLCGLFRQYLILGGMPEVVAAYTLTESYTDCASVQTALLNTFKNDFGKYTDVKDLPVIEELFHKAPELIGQIFKYSHVNPDYRSRDIKSSLGHLVAANLLTLVSDCHASGLPLQATVNHKRFKVNFVDVGLVTNINRLSAELMLQEDFFAINRGAIMEQFVGQELLAYSDAVRPGELYFWTKDQKNRSKAEVDYVLQWDDRIIPLEVKAGKTGRLKSLQIFLADKKLPVGVRVSLHPLSRDANVLSVPAYMISELPRLLAQG